MSTENLIEFYDRCARLDWFWQYADAWSLPHIIRARKEQAMLIAETKKDPEKARIYSEFAAYNYSGEPFGKPRRPKPERPQ